MASDGIREGGPAEGAESALEARFREISAEHGAALARLVTGYEADEARQQDLMQEILVAIWRGLPSFEGRASVRTWGRCPMSGDDDRLRALWRDQPVKEAGQMSIQALRERSERLARRVSRRKWSEAIAGGVSMALLIALGARERSAPLVQVACAMLVIGEAVVIANLWRRSRPTEAPLDASTVSHLARYRAELVKERDRRSSVARWYLAPTLPGLVFFPIAVALELGVSAVVVGAVAVASLALVEGIVVGLGRRSAQRLAREIEALGAG